MFMRGPIPGCLTSLKRCCVSLLLFLNLSEPHSLGCNADMTLAHFLCPSTVIPLHSTAAITEEILCCDALLCVCELDNAVRVSMCQYIRKEVTEPCLTACLLISLCAGTGHACVCSTDQTERRGGKGGNTI